MLITLPAFKTHTGICDASAAVFLKRGDTRFLVADDEDQHQTKLRLYDAAADGPPLSEFSLDNKAVRADDEEPEIDIEGSSWLGDRIFWIGSHSRSKNGKTRPSRQRLFATNYDGSRLAITGQPYCSLIRDLKENFGMSLDKKVPPKEGGLSIEGLSGTAKEGELLIAFRSPLVKRKALLISLRNPEAIVDSEAPAEFGEPVLLDLGGLGVRSIDYWPERKAYYLLAGPSGDGGGQFQLFRWSGSVSTSPEPIEAVDFAAMGIGDDEAPEALLIEPDSSTVYILFDEGNRVVNGQKCKDAEEQSFRSMSISFL
jgi:hypothetical protein